MLTRRCQVVVAYFYEAILVTIFLLLYLVDASRKHGRWHRRQRPNSTLLVDAGVVSRPPPPAGFLDKTIDTFRHSVKPFLETAAFFAISMLVAALYSAKILKKQRQEYKDPPSPLLFLQVPNLFIRTVPGYYDISLGLLTTLFSILPMYILALICDQGHRRSYQRRLIVLASYALCVFLVFYSPKAEWETDGWENLAERCNKRGGNRYPKAVRALQVLVPALPVLWALAWVIIFNKLGWSRLGQSRTLLRLRSWFVIGSAVSALLCMWALLALSYVMRSKIIDTAGNTDQSNDIGFGQILAAFAWMPTLITLGYVAICKLAGILAIVHQTSADHFF